MDRKNFYDKQPVTEAELDAAFDGAENAVHDRLEDAAAYGVVKGFLTASEATTAVTFSAGVLYDKKGRRIEIAAPLAHDIEEDTAFNETAVVSSGNERWVSVYARWGRSPADPRTDLLGATVYFDQPETLNSDDTVAGEGAFLVVSGTEAAAGEGIRPALHADAILVADFRRVFGSTAVELHTDRVERFTGGRFTSGLDALPSFFPVDVVGMSAGTVDQGAAGGLAFRADASLASPAAYRYLVAFTGSAYTYRSIDGINWLSNGASGTFGGISHPRGIFYSKIAGRWIIAAKTGATDKILTSLDPTSSWEVSADPSTAGDSRGGMCESRQVIIMPCSVTALSSADGVNWSEFTGSSGTTGRAAAYSPELDLFVLVGTGGAIETSPGDISGGWTNRGPVSEDCNDVCWDPVYGFFVCGDAGMVVSSPTGTSWTDGTLPDMVNEDFTSIVSDGRGGLTMASTNYVLHSKDGAKSWTVQRRPGNIGSATAPFVHYSDNRLFLCGTDGVGAGFGLSLGMKNAINPIVVTP